MKKFTVCLTRDTTESCFVDVEAKDENDAAGKAIDLCIRDAKAGRKAKLDFQPDDGNIPQRPYASSVEERG